MRCEIPRLNRGIALQTVGLEGDRGAELMVERRNALISSGTPVAKAAHWVSSDAEARKLGERTGLDTPVVLAVNDER